MERELPKYVRKPEVDRHGKSRVYFKKPGQRKIALHAPIGTPEFWNEYANALSGVTQPAEKKAAPIIKGSLDELWNLYLGSASYQALVPNTQYYYRVVMQPILAAHGRKEVRLLEYKHIDAVIRSVERPGTANSVLKVLRQVFKLGMKLHMIPLNPARDVEHRPMPNGQEGIHTWTHEEIQQYRDHYALGTEERTTLELFLGTAQRVSDVVRFGPEHIGADGFLHFTQRKNSRRKPVKMALPIQPELRIALDAAMEPQHQRRYRRTYTDRSQAAPLGTTFLVNAEGNPHNPDVFWRTFRHYCDHAGLPEHCSAHGLRKATLTMLAERGASVHEIQAISGHRTLEQVQRYTRAAEQKQLAIRALARLEAEQKAPTDDRDAPTKIVKLKVGAK